MPPIGPVNPIQLQVPDSMGDIVGWRAGIRSQSWREQDLRREDGIHRCSCSVRRGAWSGGSPPSLAFREKSTSGQMVAGHFGFAAIVKSQEKSAPLWALMLATAWLDVVFVPLLIAHWETFEAVHAGYGGLIIHANYTHSIVGMLVLSAILGAMFLPKLGNRVALVVALVSASHWMLDLVVHRPDMPVLPGNFGSLPYFGLGLWNHPQAAACVELILVVAGALMYWRAAMEVSAKARRNGKLASVSAAMIAVFGILVLILDYTS
jgi:membrane-bound metal-dependent hydrolase YbcI (DUF457 family)